MGSRVMHLIIANEIAKKLPIEDKGSFLLGGIAPDAVSPKELSHFFTGDVKDFSRNIDYETFIEKYSSSKESSYILGYYSHLIADDLWLKGFFLSWLNNRIEHDENMVNNYHNDFRLLNGKLLDYYGIGSDILNDIKIGHSIVEIDEVTKQDVQDLMPFIAEDMVYDESVLDEKLNVFTFDQIVGYIETSIEKGIMLIQPKLSKKIH
ncbi:zinc dependent phospholipase C family protein [Lederbergia citri]|uniref:Zinc dependent phospholipase C family protein n=1 Tax=Lederbergia citri TaxID=2833580 RepID=A0A942TBU2_9BACI|nr:zinc dependent phospholipase C family protein [Lederbergia citri]MBS4193587.1 zinc dependent phospholipase C family protein [Lederbergia citri]